MANQRVYCHELFKINFTGVPSPSSPVSPRFFPALLLAFVFFAPAPLSERLEQAMFFDIKERVRHNDYSRSSPYVHSGKRPALVTTSIVKLITKALISDRSRTRLQPLL